MLLKSPFKAPLATSAEVFQALVTACDQYRAEEHGPSLKFYIEHSQVVVDVHSHLPEASDGSVAGYAARLAERLGPRNFILYVTDFQVYDATLWMRIRDFLDGLYKLVGIPASHAELELFLGRYDCTPGGVHKEPCANFHFVIEGHKRMHIWSKGVWDPKTSAVDSLNDERYLDQVNFEQYLDQAVTLDGYAGDVLYWPAGDWHIGEAPELSVCLTVALYMEGRPYDIIKNVVSDLVETRLGDTNSVESFPFQPTRVQERAIIPDGLMRSARTLRQVSHDLALQKAIAAEWMRRVTSSGFNKVPARPAPKALANHVLVRGDTRYPIIWAQLDKDELIYAANGYCAIAPAHPNVIKMLQHLNSGAVSTVNDLFDEYAGVTVMEGDVEIEVTREALRAILEDLYSMRMRAITRGD